MLKLVEFLLILPLIESKFRVYHSHYPVSNNDHDCFYRFEKSSRSLARHLVSYCIRHNSIYSQEKCFGISYTFKDLRLRNITTTQLFQRFAPIDMIDDYAAYLLLDMENNIREEIYCNCMDHGSFGKFCQYQFYLEYDESSFDKILLETLLSNTIDERDVYLIDEQNFSTCYKLFNCVTLFGFCLDWREINDGVQHCINDEDERDFVAMELSECDFKKEYRCRNGLCIPRTFLFDLTYDCPDWYDEQLIYSPYVEPVHFTCSSKMATAECEEHRFGLNYFSCGDGERLVANTYDRESCMNIRNILMLKTLFRPYLNQITINTCYNAMFRSVGISCLFLPCWGESTSYRFPSSFVKNDFLCPDFSFFPPGPFVFSFVRLLYKAYDFQQDCRRPDFICWNQSFCNIYPNKTIFEHQGFHCVPIESFGSWLDGCMRSSYRSFTDLVLIVQTLFSHCTEKKTYPTLYTCLNHLSISAHRLMDTRFHDCSPWEFNNEDENANNHTYMMICHLPDRFLCDGYHCIPRRAIQDGSADCKASPYFDERFGIECEEEFGCQYLREMNLKNSISLMN